MVVGAIEKSDKALLDGAKKVSSKLKEGVSVVASKTKSLVDKVRDLWNKGKTAVKNAFVQADKKIQHVIKTLLEYEWIPGEGASISLASGRKGRGVHRGSYYGYSTGPTGKVKVIKSTDGYIATTNDKATVIQID
ncbi:hypothetical protein [Bacillus sp. 166amftsu]|uniref:hypothetical protein n=1 Tax=Bacillus sp. 166amftsu TaxID=1761753 RepID=UPI0008991B4C|nr:hypothetical protein [Bacillus sp. 166amftsu]SDY78407.1 hypothetical protein SAMN04488156_102373 [Bacillus sp. 166amftsu]